MADVLLSKDNCDLLNKVVDENLDQYSIKVDDSNKKGEGYMGEMCYVSLTNKNNGQTIGIVIKQAFTDEKLRKVVPLRKVYENEIYFYVKLWPRFKKIQSDYSLSEHFDKIPKCFTTSLEIGHEKLVLENLKYQGFQIYDKTKPLDDEHLSYIFKEYGKLHGISFAYKTLNPEEYEELVKGIKDPWFELTKQQFFADHFNYIGEISLESIDSQQDVEAIEKFRPYLGKMRDIFWEKCNYHGEYTVVLHGDCWSNNMMFKYDESKRLSDIRLLDFQCSKVGTPVHDLSYCLYTSGSKEIFDNLDHYLRIYHDSLSETLRKFGLNPDSIYPFGALKEDWKKYCVVGFMIGLLIWRGKLGRQEDIKDSSDISNEDEIYQKTEYDVDKYRTTVRGLILHMVENDFLEIRDN